MKTAEVVFIPAWGISHLVPMVEMAKLFITRHEQLSVTILIMKYDTDNGISPYVNSLLVSKIQRLSIVEVPQRDSKTYVSKHRSTRFSAFVETQKAHARDIILSIASSKTTRLVGCIIDMFCFTLADIADEVNVPTYVFSPASASFLGLMFYLQNLSDDHNQDITLFKNSETKFSVPSYTDPVPAKVLPLVLLDEEGGSDLFLSIARRLRDVKGILVNTFMELESHALESLASDCKIPTFYPVGPILNFTREGGNVEETVTVLCWLDKQPPSSVVFMCFGSHGSFQVHQVKEIALAVERSGRRFIWSLRPPPSEGETEVPREYSYLDEVLPSGFLDRTAEFGKVIGWAPQVSVLSHQAVGGFVSHCGWNSILESLWFGVPMAAWPLYAEQQVNAFKLVIELGLAVDIKMDYRNESGANKKVIVSADEIDRKISELMMDGSENEVRKKVAEMKEKSRLAVSENGSSYTSIGRLIKEMIS
uniref:Glycosyltransferase n=1 Tax=Centella asiatica TaxID=48106 RepID=A0A2I7M6F0_CENAS|nr:UDP-glucosyltransferase 71A32 [Centella asiatica]